MVGIKSRRAVSRRRGWASAARVMALALGALLAAVPEAAAQLEQLKRCNDLGDPAVLDCEAYGSVVPNDEILTITEVLDVLNSANETDIVGDAQAAMVIQDPTILALIGASGASGTQAIEGNAACTDSGGVCNRETGENCALPCVVCPGADDLVGVDPTEGALDCPSVASDDEEFLDRGVVFFGNDAFGEICTGGETTVNDRAFFTFTLATTGQPDRDGSNVTQTCPGNTPPVNDFKCYAAKPEPRTRFERREVEITDQFGTRSAVIARPFEICAPVDKNGEGIEDPEAHLTCYKQISRQRDPWRILGDIDQFTVPEDGVFTPEDLIVGRAAELCFPAVKDCVEEEGGECADALAGVEERLSHFQCYQARSIAENPFVPGALALEDQFGATTSDAGAAIKHCNPITVKSLDGGDLEELSVTTFPSPPTGETRFWEGGEDVHLKCYDLDDETRVRRSSVEIRDQLHPDGYPLRVGTAIQLCEPAVKVFGDEPAVEAPEEE